MEGYTLRQQPLAALRGPSRLLKLATDERLIELTRRGEQAAFEVLVTRYRARLLAFNRHMLGSREDAEDVLQEVFAAAFNAILADSRAINVRPWLYRIARNRCLNHLRRQTAIGVDSMDVHFADAGLSTSDKAAGREDFRLLMDDIGRLPEAQRTALLLREMEALTYEQVAETMETTVPSVKSLLVRARVGLAEAAEARKLSCEEVRLELGAVAEGISSLTPPVRRHMKGCERCTAFRRQLRETNRALAALSPLGPLLLFKHFLLAKLGLGAGSATSGGAAAAGTTGAGSAGALTASAVTVKAVAGIAAAAIVTAGAVAVHHANSHPSSGALTPPPPAVVSPVAPAAVASTPQPATVATSTASGNGVAAPRHHRSLAITGGTAAGSHQTHRLLPSGTTSASTGTTGPIVPISAIGATGATAASGVTGVTGTTGASGPSAPVVPVTQEVTSTTTFPSAATGPTGATSSNGTTGVSGATGAKGSTGSRGVSGPTGATTRTTLGGATGSVDAAGGATGATGS